MTYDQWVSETIDAPLAQLAALSASHGRPVTCAAGCSFCCRMQVDCGPEDAQRLAAAIRASERRQLFIAALERQVVRGRGLDHARYWNAQIPCALLRDGRCEVYEARPVLCRLHAAVSRPRLCRKMRGATIDVFSLFAAYSRRVNGAGGWMPELVLELLRSPNPGGP
jgi:Fe-S-cluster containining protein